MEGERRQEKTQSLMGLTVQQGRRRRKKELLFCHTFGESHRRRQNRSSGEKQMELLTKGGKEERKMECRRKGGEDYSSEGRW